LRYIYLMEIDDIQHVVNLTPHAVKVVDEHGKTVLELAKPAEGTVLPRVGVESSLEGHIDWGVPVFKSKLSAVEGLPEPKEGVAYLVSTMVRTASPDRQDLVSPGELVRDADGKPVGCKGLTIS